MDTSTDDPRANAVAAATAWWDGKPFPRSSSGEPYLCAWCGGPIWHREGTSRIGVQMLCPGCTSQYLAHAPAAAAGVTPPDTAGRVTAAPPHSPPGAGPVEPEPPKPARRHGHRGRAWAVAALVLGVVMVAGLLMWAPWTRPEVPAGLTASSTATTVTVGWAPRSTGPEVERYVILRRTLRTTMEEVGFVPGSATTYVDTGLRPGASYAYQVVAAAGSRRSAPSATATAETVMPLPFDLKPMAATTTTVTFGWSPPPDAPTPDEYVVMFADGTDVATIPGTFPASDPTYEATGLQLGTTYSFQIAAVWDGHQSSPSTALEVTTLTPPVSDARLVTGPPGVPVQFTMTGSHFDNVAVGTTFTNTWVFTPGCATGPCDVTLDGRITPETFKDYPFKMTLTRAGAVYTGQTTAVLSECNGVDVTSTVNVTLTVTAAAGPDWTASQWDGTFESNEPYTSPPGEYYCPAGKETATIGTAAPAGA